MATESGEDDRADLEQRVDDLEEIVTEQRQTIKKMLPGRRQFLKGAGAGGLAALGGLGLLDGASQETEAAKGDRGVGGPNDYWPAVYTDYLETSNAEVNSITTEVGSNNQLSGIVEPSEIRIYVLGDVHWNDEGFHSGLSYIKSKLDTAIDNARAADADLVLQVGDLVHGNMSDDSTPSQSQMVTWISDARDYIENSGGSEGNGVGVPVHYQLGNHEYKGAGQWDMSALYDAFGFGTSLSDTWQYYDLGPWQFLSLNNAYGTVNDPSQQNSNGFPSQEIDFIAETLKGKQGNGDGSHTVGKPTLLMTHHPLDHGVLNEYDYAYGSSEVAKIVSQLSPNALCLHGHSHHSMATINSRLGQHGLTHLHAHKVGNNGSGLLRLYEGGWDFDPLKNKTRGGMASVHGDPAFQRARLRTMGRVFERFYPFESLSRYTTVNKTSLSSGGATLKSAGSLTEIKHRPTMGLRPFGTGGIVGWPERMWACSYIPSSVGQNETFRLGSGSPPNDDFIGFKQVNGELQVHSKSGSNSVTKTVINDLSGYNSLTLGFWNKIDESRTTGLSGPTFYVNGQGKNRISDLSAVPTKEADANMLFYFSANTSDTSNRVFQVDHVWVRQPYLEEIGNEP